MTSVISVILLAACSGAQQTPVRTDYGCVESALRSGVEARDAQDAQAFFGSSCARGAQEACSVLGVLFEEGIGAPRDTSRARTLYEGACRAEVPRACTNLGRLLRTDESGAPLALFRQACDGGDLGGCAELGRLARDGVGMPRNLELAGFLFERACDAAQADACGDLARLPGLSQSEAESAARRGCALGDARSCTHPSSLSTAPAVATFAHPSDD
jgi:TPR repeat protein